MCRPRKQLDKEEEVEEGSRQVLFSCRLYACDYIYDQPNPLFSSIVCFLLVGTKIMSSHRRKQSELLRTKQTDILTIRNSILNLKLIMNVSGQM